MFSDLLGAARNLTNPSEFLKALESVSFKTLNVRYRAAGVRRATRSFPGQVTELSLFSTANTTCLWACYGVPDGYYQSCRGCSFYVRCAQGRPNHYQCGNEQFWHDGEQQCVNASGTCVVRAGTSAPLQLGWVTVGQ